MSSGTFRSTPLAVPPILRCKPRRLSSAQQQLATWGIRTLAALCVASKSGDRFGLSHFKEPSLGHVLSRLLSLHTGACELVSAGAN